MVKMNIIYLTIWFAIITTIYSVESEKRHTFSAFYEDEKNFGFYPYHPKRSSILEDEDNIGFYPYYGNSKRSDTFSAFYEDEDNFGFYPYHPKRSSILKDEDNIGFYPYHGNSKRSEMKSKPNKRYTFSAFYEDEDNYGFYPYHPKRSEKKGRPMKRHTFSAFYEDDDNYEFYGYHPKRSLILKDEDNIGFYPYHGNSKRSEMKSKPNKRYTFSAFYEDEDNYGFYPYHPKRSEKKGRPMKRHTFSAFYEDDDNYGFYGYHPKRSEIKSRQNKRHTFSAFYEDEKNFGYFPAHPKRSVVRETRQNGHSARKLSVRSANAFHYEKFKNITHCQYDRNTSLLTCLNSQITPEPIECQADVNLNETSQFNFTSFGIEISFNNQTDRVFNLYPFKDNQIDGKRIFYNYQIKINNKLIVFKMFNSNTTDYSGINVKEKSCYEKLTDLFVSSAELKTVDFTISSDNVLTKILFVGDVYVEDHKEDPLIK